MPKNRFTVKNSLNVEQDIAVKATPDTCPCCHKGIQPSFCFSFIHDSDTPTTSVINAEVVFRCPLQKCQRLFIAYYSAAALRGQSVMEFGLNGLLPYTHENTKFPESVEKLSPKFCEIYNEAAWAESLKLLNVAGPGYRKALEFLVKDNVCAEEPGETEKIIKMALQNVIQNKIQDRKLKACAERAAWLGNDETHYLRIWLDKDIEDEKRLIKLCVNWIESHLLMKEYEKSMPPKKP